MLTLKLTPSRIFLLGCLTTNVFAIPMSEAPSMLPYAPFNDGECQVNRWYNAEIITAEGGTIPIEPATGQNTADRANLYMCFTAKDIEEDFGITVVDLRADGTKKNQLHWVARCEYEDIESSSWFEYAISDQGRVATCKENGEMLSSRTVPGYMPSINGD